MSTDSQTVGTKKDEKLREGGETSQRENDWGVAEAAAGAESGHQDNLAGAGQRGCGCVVERRKRK